MLLRLATQEDVPAMVALERMEESKRFVGQWSEERHRETLSSVDARYFVHESATGTLSGYAILRGLAEASGSIELKRLVVDPPGQGLGRRILEELLHIAFGQLRAHRVFLDVFEDNPRAIHLYRSAGFEQEGVMREAALREGRYCSLHLLSMIDREYEGRRGGAPPL
jgi:RimJ/RimL family protein N-acetyltransferase